MLLLLFRPRGQAVTPSGHGGVGYVEKRFKPVKSMLRLDEYEKYKKREQDIWIAIKLLWE